MAIFKIIRAKFQAARAKQRSKKTLQPGTYLPKRFPFIWLYLLLFISSPGNCQELLAIRFDALSTAQYSQLAGENLFDLPTATVEYTASPFIIRPKNDAAHTLDIRVSLTSGWQDSIGRVLSGATLDWTLAAWVWEGREEAGPAPGLQFSATIPLLCPPGSYTAAVQVSLLKQNLIVDSFPLTLHLNVPSWATCRPWPQIARVQQKSLGNPGQKIVESEPMQLIVAANSGWQLWLEAAWLSEPELAAEGSSTITSYSGYLVQPYRLRAPLGISLPSIPLTPLQIKITAINIVDYR